MDMGNFEKIYEKRSAFFLNLFLIFLNLKKKFVFFFISIPPYCPEKTPKLKIKKKNPYIDICYNGISSFVCNDLFCICIELCTIRIDSECPQSARQFCM